MDAVIALLDSWQPPALDGADKRALLLGAVRAAGLTKPPAPAPVRAAPQRPPPQQGARRPRRAPSLRRLQRVLRALPRRVDDLQLRDLLARSDDAGAGPGREAGDGRPQAGAEGGRPGAGRRLRMGQPSRSGRRPSTAPAWSASPSPPRRPKRRGSGPRRRASPTGSRSTSWTTATSPASASTRSPASAWSSTSALPRSTSTRAPWPGCWSRAGACSTTASPACATPTARRGRSRSATSSPTRRPLHLSRDLLALERAGFVTRHVEEFGADYAETLRHWARRLDENLDEAIRLAGPERVRVGGSTCAPHAMASRAASPRFTRPAAGSPSSSR